MGPAVVIDIAARAEEDPDTMVTVDDLKSWEMENGDIPEGRIRNDVFRLGASHWHAHFPR